MKSAEYSDLAARFLASVESTSSINTFRAYSQHLARFERFLKSNEIGEITPLILSEYGQDLRSSGVSNNSASLYMSSVSRFFAWCVRHGVHDTAPIAREDIPRPLYTEKEIPTIEEIEKLLTYQPPMIASPLPIRNRTIIFTLIYSGLRNEELRDLRLDDLQFGEEGYILVRSGKGGKARKAPFPAAAQNMMRVYLAAGIRPDGCAPDDYLFGSQKDSEGNILPEEWHKMESSTLYRIVARFSRSAIGREITPHALRHCAASLWDHCGASLRDVQQALGHSSITTTEKVYVHILNGKKSAAAIDRKLEGAAI